MTTLDRRKELDLAISRMVASMAGGPAAFAKARDELLDLALSSLPAQAVGVKLVPVEKLTPEMRAAAETAARKINPGRSEDHIKSVALDGLSIYRAIVAATPSQPAAVGERADALWEQLLPFMQVEECSPGDPYKDKVAALALIEAVLVHRDQVKL